MSSRLRTFIFKKKQRENIVFTNNFKFPSTEMPNHTEKTYIDHVIYTVTKNNLTNVNVVLVRIQEEYITFHK